MTLGQFALILYKVGEDGKLRTIKTFIGLTGLKIRESKNIVDTYSMYRDQYLLINIKFIMIYLHSLSYWKDVKSHIRKTNFNTFIKDNNILI